jgi:hypothetical protein
VLPKNRLIVSLIPRAMVFVMTISMHMAGGRFMVSDLIHIY